MTSQLLSLPDPLIMRKLVFHYSYLSFTSTSRPKSDGLKIDVGFLLCLFPFKRPDSQPRCDAGQKSTWKKSPLPVLTRLSANRVLHNMSGSLHPLHFDNQWRFIMGAEQGSGGSLKKIPILRVMSPDMWVKSGFDWSAYHRRLCFIMQPERERETVLGWRPCWIKTTVTFYRCCDHR